MAQKEKEAVVVAENRKARFNYHILDRLEAGIALVGSEVKALRFQGANLIDAHADYRNGEFILLHMDIPKYKGANRMNHEPRRNRTLLLHRREIKKLQGKMLMKGFSVVPLSVYFNARGIAKVELALVQGKKAHDKRETEKQRDWSREKGRVMRRESE